MNYAIVTLSAKNNVGTCETVIAFEPRGAVGTIELLERALAEAAKTYKNNDIYEVVGVKLSA